MTHQWAAPLPSFDTPAFSQRLRLERREFRIQISPVMRGVDGEADTDVIQLRVLHAGKPLAAADLGLTGAACLSAWSYLCNKLTEAIVDFYAPKQRFEGEPNPRLGCWGARPDLVERGLAENDCGLAVVIGLATWTVGTTPMGTDQELVERIAGATVRALGNWVVTAEREQLRRN